MKLDSCNFLNDMTLAVLCCSSVALHCGGRGYCRRLLGRFFFFSSKNLRNGFLDWKIPTQPTLQFDERLVGEKCIFDLELLQLMLIEMCHVDLNYKAVHALKSLFPSMIIAYLILGQQIIRKFQSKYLKVLTQVLFCFFICSGKR